MKHYAIVFLQILLITLIAGCTDISDELISGEEIADQFIEKQENIQDYSATATVTTTRPEDSYTIKMMFKKPNKHRIEYPEPLENRGIGIVVVDGSTGTWVYYPGRNSADHFIEPDRKDDEIPNFLVMDYYIIAKDILKKSNISYKGTEKISEHGTYVIEGLLEESNNYNMDTDVHKIRVWIDKKSWIIQKMIFYDEKNNPIRTVESIDIESNIGISDNEFVFEPPEGVETDEIYIWFASKKPIFNSSGIVYSTPTNESELISIVFPETWLMENEENEDPRIIDVSFPALQLRKLRIDNEEYAHYLTPEEIVNNEKVALLTMPKTMFTLLNKDPDTVVINFPIEKFEFYPNVSEMLKQINDTKGE